MRYACLIYFDPTKVFDGSETGASVLRDAPGSNESLAAAGHLVGAHALVLPSSAMTVRVRDGKASTTDGPFMETKEMLGGIVVIEARDLNEAVRLAAEIPFARVGAIEVRPLVDPSMKRPQL